MYILSADVRANTPGFPTYTMNWCDRHEVKVEHIFTHGVSIVRYTVSGLTAMYCKAVSTEIRARLKEEWGTKIVIKMQMIEKEGES